MKTVLILIPLAALLVAALVIRYKAAQVAFNFLTRDETDHAAKPPDVDAWGWLIVPDGFTCQDCGENPALPSPSIWCAVCTPVVDQHPSEPIERRVIPVTDWDAYSITYNCVAVSRRGLTDMFAAESAEAAAAAVIERNPGATVIEVINITNNSEYERGAR